MLILRYFKNLFRYKFYFNFPSNKEIIIYDNSTMSEIKQIVKDYKYIELDLRNNFNLFILLKILLKFKKINIKAYIQEFIQTYSPKIIISSNEHNMLFYNLKKNFPTIVFIMVQNGLRSKNFDIFDKLKKEKKKLIIDDFFLFNELIAKEYSKFISFKSHLIGSFRNNCVKINNKIKYKNSILFISQTPNKPFAYKNLKINSKDNVNFWIEEKLLIIIKNYCTKNKVNLYILGKHRGKQIKTNEKKYYLNLLKSNFKYIYAKQNNYSLIDKFDTILTINSTLGYESLARKKKCLFFNNRKINKKRISSNFWPFKIKDHGNFYSKFTDEKVINEILSKNININYKTWYNKNKKLVSKFQYFDYQNKKFKFLINSYLNV